MVSSCSLPDGLITRARIALMAAEGTSSRAITRKRVLSAQAICEWSTRYLQQGLPGLHDELRPPPLSILDETVAALIRKTLPIKPQDGIHWAIRSIAKEIKLSGPTYPLHLADL